jgi:hypothetical protein
MRTVTRISKIANVQTIRPILMTFWIENLAVI